MENLKMKVLCDVYEERYGERPVVNEVVKNNDVKLIGLCIPPEGSGISPTLYLDKYLKRGYSLDELVEAIHEDYEEVRLNTPEISKDEIINSEYIVNNCFVRLVNSNNVDYLKDIITKEFCDGLTLEIRVKVEAFGNGFGSYGLKQGTIKCDEDELFERAISNTQKFFPVRFSNLAEELRGFVPEEDLEKIENDPLHVLSNTEKMNGATVVCYPGVLDSVLEKLDTDKLYLLPSSIHEFLVVDARLGEEMEECYKEMIPEVNASDVLDTDVLSSNLYIYDHENGLRIA